jgi:predicted transcriptional regulator
VNAQMKRKEKLDRLSPIAQYILLCYFSSKKVKSKFTIRELEEITPYNYVAIARAVTNLEDCGLCQAEIDSTRTKHVYFAESKRELWGNAQKYLV